MTKKSPPKQTSFLKKYRNYIVIASILLFFITTALAADETGIEEAMKSLCKSATAFLAIGTMLLVILAAAVYAIGQILGAETRARASVWATAMLTGAIIGIVIYLILPPLIETMLGQEIDCGTGTGGSTVGSTQQAVIEPPPGPGQIPKKIPFPP